MSVVLPSPTGRFTCRWCDRDLDETRGESFFGPSGWVRHWYCCKHVIEYSCRGCYQAHREKREFAACPTCGCSTEYT